MAKRNAGRSGSSKGGSSRNGRRSSSSRKRNRNVRIGWRAAAWAENAAEEPDEGDSEGRGRQ